ncbi:hypothetical protein FisN_2Lh136 [Fistulifera solaris]|uniref:Tudor domain-containing protein n=1 Tax=Fistulifera solaris TaxID=1519565 RepID=A0A1Z5JX54_FISSO|nr:hypothetical protein FisN_2Lh136 [Fistulifera solaris]|eukprot:GAX18479.1 hypothetical protein FisN_2Lh136 [Fistulifera solaris]
MVLSEINNEVVWPAACPHPAEPCFVSVFVRPGYYHFAIHREKDKGYMPETNWRVPRTSIPEQLDEESDDSLSKIGQYFPPSTLGLFFPPSIDYVPTVAEVIQYMTLKQSVPVSLYVVGGNETINRNLQQLFQRYPVRILCLQSTDFGRPLHPTGLLGVTTTHDVAVAAFGASQYPAMMVECSDCVTFLTVQEPGRITSYSIHEGIVTTLQLAFPDVEDGMKLLDDFLQRDGPLVDTEPVDAIVKKVLKSFLLVVGTTMETFVQLYGPNIVLHGPRAGLLHALLQQHTKVELKFDFVSDVQVDDHYIHAAIGKMLMKYDTPVVPGSCRETCLQFVGQRIARIFETETEQDSIYRGIVSGFGAIPPDGSWDDTLFEVIYDDGDREEINVEQLYAALRLYHTVGEKHQFPSTSVDAIASKRQASQAGAAFLLKSSATVQRAVERQQVASSDVSYATESEEEPACKRKGPQIQSVTPAKRRYPSKQAAQKQTTRKLTTKRSTSMKSSNRNTNQLHADQSPTDFIGQRITKSFDQGYFDGTIISYDEDAKYWKVQYDDGDKEDFDYDEVTESISLNVFLHSDQTQSVSVSISDGEQGGIPSKAMADEAKEGLHPVQLTGTEMPVLSTSIHMQGLAQETSHQLPDDQNPTVFVERRVTKYFDGVRYDGTIVSYDQDAKFWKVVYDDGDSEEFEYDDVVHSISLSMT